MLSAHRATALALLLIPACSSPEPRESLSTGSAAITVAAKPAPAPSYPSLDSATPTAASNVVLQWNASALQAIRVTHPGPPIVARALAVLQTSEYEAWAAYDSVAVGTRLGATLRRPASEATDANKREAVSYAAYRTLVDLFPTQSFAFASLLTSLGYDPSDASADATTPSGIGNTAAAAVIAFRHSDGANQLGDLHPGAYSDYTGYASVNTPDAIVDPNRWQPLRVPDGQGGEVVQKFIAPQWGNVVPFGLTSAAQFRGAGPVTNNGQYQKQVEEILHYSEQLTDTQKVIAEYWADGPKSELPPGHWCLFATFVSVRDGHTLDQDVKMFFAMTNAVFDASIAAWESKRHFDSVRPVTAVHYTKGGKPVHAWAGPFQGVQNIDGASWAPYQAATVVTPPFPEYPSGHSTFSAAAAEVLKSFTGSDALGASTTQKAGVSRVEPGAVPASDVTLAWDTFSTAADEAGISRRYGGIHFVTGDLDGRVLGRQVGAQAWTRAQEYFAGTP
jgi:hypothetical protein